MNSQSGSHTVELRTYGSQDSVAVRLTDACTVEKAKDEICKRTGLHPNSMSVFGLFLGPLEQPTKILLDKDVIPTGADICIRRWNFDVEREIKLVRKDDVAINLLYNEAVYHLDKGIIQPTDSQYQELESFSDPTFPTERQYLELISTIPGYTSYVTEGCKLLGDIVTNDAHIPSGTVVHCVMDMHSLALKGDIRKSESLIEWPWTSVRRWKLPSSNEIRFELCLQRGNAPMMCWVTLNTTMAQILFHTSSGICGEVKRLQDKAEVPLPPPNPQAAGKHYDPLIEFVDNILFKGPKFDSIP